MIITGLATDPPVSEKQRRAMYAAAAGKSTLGIPEKVGKEFVGEGDEAPFNEADHPRAPDGKFGSGGGGGASSTTTAAAPKRSMADKVKAHAETIKKYGAATKDWIKSQSASDIIGKIASNEKLHHAGKEAMSFSLQSLVSHGTGMFHAMGIPVPHIQGLDPSTWHMNEEIANYAVQHFADIAAISKLQAKEVMRKTVSAMIAARRMPAAVDEAGDDEDGITKALKALLDLLEDDEPEGEEKPKPNGTAADAAPLAFDRAIEDDGRIRRHGIQFAFDKDSVRTRSPDGHMHVAVSNISKAAINEYLGSEINEVMKDDPGWKMLVPERKYRLLRDPEELEKAAPTFNNLPILSEHVPATASDHPAHLVIGSTGTDAEFSPPYLRNSLVIWPKGGIDAIESEAKKELSSAYRYRADMTPGVYEGEPYDGVMRDLFGNHIALVKEGRAGSDVVVGDSKENLIMSGKTIKLTRKALMTTGALAVYLKPKLAQDAKVDTAELGPAFEGLTDKNFKERRPAIVTGLKKMTEGKLAKDASLEDVEKVLDMLDGHEIGDADPALEPNAGAPMLDDTTMDADPAEQLRGFLKTKGMADDDIETACGMAGPKKAMDAEETDEEKKKREEKEKADKDKKASDEPPPFNGKPEPGGKMVSEKAMDAAIKTAVKSAVETATKTQMDIREAEKAVRPYIGDLAVAMDSAEKVYAAALKQGGVNIEGVHPSAYPALLKMLPVPNANGKKTAVAMDAASTKGFNERFPETARIGMV